MARLRARFVAMGVVLAVLLALTPPTSHAQSTGEVFAEALATQQTGAPLAGPHALDLAQQAGVLTVYKAGLDVADFVAHATFVNPEVVDGVGWDYGFQFRTTGNNEDFRVFVTSDGMWNFSIGTATPSQSAVAPGFDVTPGVANSLDLVVDGTRALFGVNGQLAGAMQLPDEPATGDVFASTGFLGSLVSEGRVVSLSDFTVFPLPGAASPAEQAAQGVPPARPVALVAGSCAEPGAAVLDLLEATYPIGERVGAASSVVAETSFTRAPVLLADLLAAPHAILVAESFDAPANLIACADLGGIPDELGGFVIGLTPQNASGYAGTIFMAADDATGATNISVFLNPVGQAGADEVSSDVVVEAPTVEEPAASPIPDAAEVEAVVEEAAVEGSVIEIETGDEATP